jgi:hypothetical protein
MDFVEASASSLNATRKVSPRKVTRFIECNSMYVLTLSLTLCDHENCIFFHSISSTGGNVTCLQL